MGIETLPVNTCEGGKLPTSLADCTRARRASANPHSPEKIDYGYWLIAAAFVAQFIAYDGALIAVAGLSLLSAVLLGNVPLVRRSA